MYTAKFKYFGFMPYVSYTCFSSVYTGMCVSVISAFLANISVHEATTTSWLVHYSVYCENQQLQRGPSGAQD